MHRAGDVALFELRVLPHIDHEWRIWAAGPEAPSQLVDRELLCPFDRAARVDPARESAV